MLDVKIRVRLLRVWLGKSKQRSMLFSGMIFVPAMAVLLLMVVGAPVNAPSSIDTTALVAEIRTAQAAELAKAEDSIYHMKRVITEGQDKAAFVAVQDPTSDPFVEARVDEVETWQHSDTALALIESNGTERSFESFLSREHDGELSLHHYGPKDQSVETERVAYDTAHDLASLYTDYASLERPTIPVLPENATLTTVDESAGEVHFRTPIADGLAVAYVVDMETKLVVEEVIYVVGEQDEYEMTRISYTARTVIPADQFEDVFDPTQYPFELIAST